MLKRVTILTIVVVLLFAISGTSLANPGRIVSLTPGVTEMLFALGVGEQVVGVTSWCTYPAEAQKRTVIGDAFNLNLETLISLEPDLVVGDATMVGRYLDKLTELGIPVFSIAPSDISGIAEAMISLGEAVGAKEQGIAIADNMLAEIDKLVSELPSDQELTVFVETWNEPLSTVGPGSFIDELLTLAKAKNIAGDADGPWIQFSEEQVITRDPQVIILTNYNKDEVEKRRGWSEISAVANGRVYEVDPDLLMRTTPRIVQALALLIDLLY